MAASKGRGRPPRRRPWRGARRGASHAAVTAETLPRKVKLPFGAQQHALVLTGRMGISWALYGILWGI